MATRYSDHGVRTNLDTEDLSAAAEFSDFELGFQSGVAVNVAGTESCLIKAANNANRREGQQLELIPSNQELQSAESVLGSNFEHHHPRPTALLSPHPPPSPIVFKTPQAPKLHHLKTTFPLQFGDKSSLALSNSQSLEYLIGKLEGQSQPPAFPDSRTNSPSSVISLHSSPSIPPLQNYTPTILRRNSLPFQNAALSSNASSPSSSALTSPRAVFASPQIPHNLPVTYHYTTTSSSDHRKRLFPGFATDSQQGVLNEGIEAATLHAQHGLSVEAHCVVDERARYSRQGFSSPTLGTTTLDFRSTSLPNTPSRRFSTDSVASIGSCLGSGWQGPTTFELYNPSSMDSPIFQSDTLAGSGHMSGHDGLSPPPAWTELKTKAGKDRKRLPLACSACRRKKIRCSGQKPSCKHCLRAKQPCVYKVNTRKATPRTDYMAMLDKRLKRMEDRVIRLIPKDVEETNGEGGDRSSLPGKITRAILKPSAQPGVTVGNKRGRKRAAQEAFGKDGGEINQDGIWRRRKNAAIGETDNEDEEDIMLHASRKEELGEGSLMLDGVTHLPPKDIQIHLAETYFDQVYGQSYPLLHKPTFMRNLSAGTVPPVLVLTVCAISARFSNHPRLKSSVEREQLFLRGEEWAAPAREIALRRHDEPNITILTVYLLLALHEFGTCQGGRSWMFGGMAQRMAFMLQLHKDKDRSSESNLPGKENTLNHTDRETRRRVIWSCFLMDRFISSGTDRPICFPEECISVPLPIKENMFIMEIAGETEMIHDNARSSNIGVTAYVVKLVSIWGDLVTYFNLGGRELEKGQEVRMWDPLSTFHSLSQSLKMFQFPPELQWNSDNLAAHKAERLDNQFIFMHIVYQHLRLFAHRWALPGHGGTSLPADTPREFVKEAAIISMEAASEVSSLINETMAIGSMVTAPFAGYAAYYSATVHVQNLFGIDRAPDSRIIERARRGLETNVRFMAKMKKWWGMFNYVGAELKQLYEEHERAFQAAKSVSDKRQEHSEKGRRSSGIFQYGDWFDKYPSGVETDEKASTREKSVESPVKKNGAVPAAPRQVGLIDQGILSGGNQQDMSVDEYFVRLENGEKPQTQTQMQTPKPVTRRQTAAAKSGVVDLQPRDHTPAPPLSVAFGSVDESSLQQNPHRYMMSSGMLGTIPDNSPGSNSIPGSSGPTSNPSPGLLSASHAGSFFSSSPLESASPLVSMDPVRAAMLDDPWGLASLTGQQPSRPVMPFGSMLAHAAADWFVPWNMNPPAMGGMMVGGGGSQMGNGGGNGMMGMQGQQGNGQQVQNSSNGAFGDIMTGNWSPVAGSGEGWDRWMNQ